MTPCLIVHSVSKLYLIVRSFPGPAPYHLFSARKLSSALTQAAAYHLISCLFILLDTALRLNICSYVPVPCQGCLFFTKPAPLPSVPSQRLITNTLFFFAGPTPSSQSFRSPRLIICSHSACVSFGLIGFAMACALLSLLVQPALLSRFTRTSASSTFLYKVRALSALR